MPVERVLASWKFGSLKFLSGFTGCFPAQLMANGFGRTQIASRQLLAPLCTVFAMRTFVGAWCFLRDQPCWGKTPKFSEEHFQNDDDNFQNWRLEKR